MHLAIDPFPILLMDEEILFRCFDSMTDPYSEGFVSKYIGTSVINQYKKTNLYTATYDSIIGEEKKNVPTFNVMKHRYIDTTKLDEIFSQLHLLSKDDIICVLLVSASEKIVKVYCYNGLEMFFTDRNTNRKDMSWSGLDYHRFSKAEERINQPYDEAYISVFQFDNEDYFVEHNDILQIEDAGNIVGFVLDGLAKMKILPETADEE